MNFDIRYICYFALTHRYIIIAVNRHTHAQHTK